VCGVTHPRVLHFVNPKFSKEARKQKVMGVAWVGLTVDSEGNPVNVHIVRSISGQVDEKCRAAALTLDARAVDAVKLYKFAPATYKGKPVPVELRVDVNFQIF
jgi:TonB family protein